MEAFPCAQDCRMWAKPNCLPICRGCAVFANAKQRLKMRPHKLWRMDRLICFLAQTLMAFYLAFVSVTGQYSTLTLVGNRRVMHFTWDSMSSCTLMARQ